MLVREVMTSPVHAVTADTTVKAALQILDAHRITALPVVDKHGRPVGVVSEIDLLSGALRVDQRLHEIPPEDDLDVPELVAEVMNHHPITVTPDSDLAAAVDLMMSTAVKSLPVVDRELLVGIVSRSDVVHALARSDELIRNEVDELVAGIEAPWLVDVDDGVVVFEGPETSGQERLARALAATVAGVVAVEVRPAVGRARTRRRK
jgi:predicted transcriptional regulator